MKFTVTVLQIESQCAKNAGMHSSKNFRRYIPGASDLIRTTSSNIRLAAVAALLNLNIRRLCGLNLRDSKQYLVACMIQSPWNDLIGPWYHNHTNDGKSGRLSYSSLTPSTPAVLNCCCSKNPAPYWSNHAPFLIFDIRALWRSGLSARAPECQKIKMVHC